MKLANLITLSRLGLVGVSFALMALHPHARTRATWSGDWFVFGFLFLAAVTDYVDGWVARRYGQTSMLGRILDPFADKVLVCGALIMFMESPDLAPLIPGWVVVLVVAREFLVQSLRAIAEASGSSFPADQLGKWKMVFQCVWVLALASYQAGWDWTVGIARYGMWIVVALTVISGGNYLRKARSVLEL